MLVTGCWTENASWLRGGHGILGSIGDGGSRNGRGNIGKFRRPTGGDRLNVQLEFVRLGPLMFNNTLVFLYHRSSEGFKGYCITKESDVIDDAAIGVRLSCKRMALVEREPGNVSMDDPAAITGRAPHQILRLSTPGGHFSPRFLSVWCGLGPHWICFGITSVIERVKHTR
jgi:hypothetical protein